MAHTKVHTKHVRHLDRKQTSFVITSLIIGVVFLISIIGIFTGKFRPFADEGGGTTNKPGQSRHIITLDSGNVTYKDATGHNQAFEGPGLQFTAAPYPSGTFSIQGVPDLSTVEAFTLTGKISMKTADGTDVTEAPVDWTSSANFSSTDRKVMFFNKPKNATHVDTLDKLDSLDDSTQLNYLFKPDYYLAVKVEGVKDSDASVPFGEVLAGDLNNNNSVDFGDVAVLAADLDQPITDANRFKDVNHNGQIGFDDFAVLASNLDKTGASF